MRTLIAAALLFAGLTVTGLAVATPAQAVVDSCGMPHREAGDPPPTARARTLTSSVVLYGDSITTQTVAALPTTWGWDAVWGRATAPTVDRLAADLAARKKAGRRAPTVLIMAIATNDFSTTDAALAYQVRRVQSLKRTYGISRVRWMNVLRTNDLPGSQRINAVIAAGGVGIIDWYTPAVAHPSWLDSSGTHLTCSGQKARAAMLKAAL